jgi:hypothetical protein
MEMRNIYISLCASLCTLFPGAFLLRDAGEGPNFLLLIVTFATAFTVLHKLDDRQRRREQDGDEMAQPHVPR